MCFVVDVWLFVVVKGCMGWIGVIVVGLDLFGFDVVFYVEVGIGIVWLYVCVKVVKCVIGDG